MERLVAMIDGAKVLAIIPARGGSKGLPRKNIRMVGGRPLIAWTIEAAKDSRYIDRMILSSDDEEIMLMAEKYGCEVPFRRSPELATDECGTMDVVIDALQRCPGYDWIVLLQPTSPLRTTADIDGAILKCVTHQARACVSVCQVEQNPYQMFFLENAHLRPVMEGPSATRRQDLPPVYLLNGAVYVAKIANLMQNRSFVPPGVVAYEMPSSRSLDIDTKHDLYLFELQQS
jgi:CMP-N,N'-diacetyllegionaminic acid synthase